MNGTAIGHLVVGNAGSTFSASAGTMVGWNAEEAASRIARVGTRSRLFSYPTSRGPAGQDPSPTAPRRTSSVRPKTVDGGILFRTAQRSGSALRHPGQHVQPGPCTGSGLAQETTGWWHPLDPVEDDQSITNDVLVCPDGRSLCTRRRWTPDRCRRSLRPWVSACTTRRSA